MCIDGHNLKTYKGYGLGECENWCNQNEECVSFDWRPVDGTSTNCALASVTASEVGNDFIDCSGSGYSYYERNCPAVPGKILLSYTKLLPPPQALFLFGGQIERRNSKGRSAYTFRLIFTKNTNAAFSHQKLKVSTHQSKALIFYFVMKKNLELGF